MDYYGILTNESFIDQLDRRLILEELSETDRKIMKMVLNRIMNGGSILRDALENKEINISDIILSIRHNRCVRTKARDLGSTYIEQVVGTSIREIFPVQYINYARRLFGLLELPESELIKHSEK